MEFNLNLLLSVFSLLVAAFVGLSGISRNKTIDDKNNSSEMTTVIVKLENIGEGIKDIKIDVKGIKEELESIKERVIIVEQSVKVAHGRLDKLEVCE